MVADDQPGASPFISFVSLSGAGMPELAGIEFTIAPRPGSVSKAVDVYYSIAALVERGDGSLDSGSVKLPVFGLYTGYANQVSLLLHFPDGSTRTLATTLTTPACVHLSASYGQPTIVKARAAGSALGIDFFVMKFALGSAVIVDTDAQLRWVAPGVGNSSSAAFQDDEFVIGDGATPTLYRLRLDGTLATSALQSTSYTKFHHNIDPGKQGLLAEVNTSSGNVMSVESTVAEMTDQRAVIGQWDLALAAGGLYPLGQHATTIISGVLLMLFNDALGSINQPAATPAGASRTYSAVSTYSIDTASMTAQNVWNFDYGQTLYSKICSSAYEASGQSILVDYAVADNYAQARLVGLDTNHDVVFDFQYPQDPTMPCSISWNALPIALDNLNIN